MVYRRDGESAFNPACRRAKRIATDNKTDLVWISEVECENERLNQFLGEKDLKIAILHSSGSPQKGEPSLAEWLVVAEKWIQLGYPVRLVLRIVDVGHSTHYWRQEHALRKDRSVKAAAPPLDGCSRTMVGLRATMP